MGKGGSGASKITTGTLEGKSVKELYDSVANNPKGKTDGIKETFNIPNANNAQTDTIWKIISGMKDYDYYGPDKKPYNIVKVSVKEIGQDKEEANRYGGRYRGKDISVNIITQPDTGKSYIDLVDRKNRTFLVGTGGKAYTFTKNSKRKYLKEFDVKFGERY